MSVGRAVLDRLGCSHAEHPDGESCEGLYLHGRCHPHSPTWARYSHGSLRVECAECGAEVCTVAVAE